MAGRAKSERSLRLPLSLSQALNVALTFALVACLIAAGASLLRGGRYHAEDHSALEGEAVEPVPAGIAPALQRTS